MNVDLTKFWIIVGVIFILWGLWMWVRKLLCTREVTGVFIKWDAMTPKKTGQQSAPVFEFYLGETLYSCRSFECFSDKQKNDLMFKPEHRYPIYVNPRRPKDMIVARRFYAEDFLVFVVAAFCFFFAAG